MYESEVMKRRNLIRKTVVGAGTLSIVGRSSNDTESSNEAPENDDDPSSTPSQTMTGSSSGMTNCDEYDRSEADKPISYDVRIDFPVNIYPVRVRIKESKNGEIVIDCRANEGGRKKLQFDLSSEKEYEYRFDIKDKDKTHTVTIEFRGTKENGHLELYRESEYKIRWIHADGGEATDNKSSTEE